MKLELLLPSLLLINSVVVGESTPALSREVAKKEVQSSNRSIQTSTNVKSSKKIPRFSKVEPSFGSANRLAQSSTPSSQPVNQVREITAVKINTTQTGIDLILETPLGEKLEVSPQTDGNTYIANIANAQLRLSNGQTFRQEKPAGGIAEVIVTNQDANSIRVTFIGEESVPKIELFDSDEGLIFGVTPVVSSSQQPPPATTQPETPSSETPSPETPSPETPSPEAPAASSEADEPIELVVTGEQDGYRVTESSTATRTDTPIRDIPQSIQVVPRQVLEDQKTVRLIDALRNVSGVFTSNSFGGTVDSFNIRGFDNASTLVNGFKESTADGNSSLRDPANIEQVEVLKGPASVLYGNVEPGGVVNIVTKQPLADPFYSAELSIGSDSFYRGSFDMSGPLTPDKALLYRLNLAYQNAGSFRDFVNSERVFAAPVFDIKLGDRTNLSINTSYLYDQRTLDRGIVAIGRGIADIPISRFLGEPGDFRRSEQFSIGYRLEHEFNDNLKIRNAFQFLQNNETVFNTNAAELDEATGTLFRDYFDSANEYTIYSMQTDLTTKFKTGSVNHQLLVGFDLQRNTLEGFFRTPSDAFDTSIADRQTPSINIFNPIYNVRPPDRSSFIFRRDDFTTTDSLGIFLQDQIALTDNVKLLVGGRFDTVTQERDDKLENSQSSQSDEAFSPRIGIVYQPIQPISLYASYSRSFAPNSGVRIDGSLVEPTRGTQYETGIRVELNPNIAANLAFYEITKSNIATTDPIDPAFSITIGEQRSRGIEFDISGQISPGWNIIASYTYTNAEITESNDFQVGNKVPNVPHNKASLWTTYEFQNGGFKGLGLGTGLFYVDARQGDLENSYELPSYIRTDAVIYYRQNNWRAAINFQNLFDVGYFETSELGRTTVLPGAPLTVIGSFTIEF
ncbi:TonB-dependent siderophore receptor [Nostoc sp. UCD121]|uniref:TonB-dependent receptor n=1 Tax=unclassified Nostoc TaxID=2593658 RepID=UPI001628099A|nr:MULTISPECIES: TonB-dependent receptor [unclassified Nostoc]MBC1218645.1 TonB-dependent siderophore receptor [Nostoc sp. UCD120]MBC1274879.1 TonB-dependent siderophore receptor [Nostoc sp. UCD121]MBC1293589.1 TonB-dependent siderophore receptor [Nostoc sp. UCD122]